MKENSAMNKILKLTLMQIIFFLALGAYAQSDGEYGTTSNLSYGTGARAMGLGRAYVAIANDPTAIFWNPSGLELVPKTSFSLFHHQLFEGVIYDFAGFAYPTLTYGTAGIGFARLGVGDVPITDRNGAPSPEKLTYEEVEIYLSYAKRLPYNFYAGTTFKIRRQSFSVINQDDTGLGFDIGVMYRPGLEEGIFSDFGLGFSFRNLLAPALKAGRITDTEPYHLTFGVVKGIRVGENANINVVFDFHKSKDESLSLLAGTEYVFRDMGTIRLGLDNMNLAFGAGVKYSFLQIDYSFGSTISDGEFPPTHRFSLTFDIGKSREELFIQADQERTQRESELVERTKEGERQNIIQESMKQGREFLTQQQYFDAYAEFQQVVSVEPFNNEANALLDSSNKMIQKQIEERQQVAIVNAVDKGLAERNAELVQQYVTQGQFYLEKNQFTDALYNFNSALQLTPDDPTIIQGINVTNRRMEEEVRKLVEQGREQFRNGNYSDALQTLSDALVLAPENQQLKDEINTLANRIKIQQYTTQALQMFDSGRYEDALKLFEEALKMDPSNQALKNYVERTKRGMGAGEQLMDPESERKYIQGVDLFLAGKYREALEIWKELETKYPYSKKLQDNIRSAEERLKRTQQ